MTEAIARRALEAARPRIMASLAIAVGVFSRAGETRFANRGMERLIATPGGPGSVRASLVSPRFEALAAGRADPIFAGILQFGDLRERAQSVRGEVRPLGADLLVVAEVDVVELERINAEIAAASSEIAVLERRATLDKRALARALDDLRATQAMLVHAEKMSAIGQMTASVAHEIDDPLAFIAGNARTMGDALRDVLAAYRALSDAVRACGGDDLRALAEAQHARLHRGALTADLGGLVHGTLVAIDRVKRIVGTLRRFARHDEADLQVADVRDCVRDALAVATPILDESGATVAIDLDDVPPVRCKPAELCQAFLNILVNAAQAVGASGRGRGHVGVRTRAEPGRILIEIEDDGVGMRPEVLARIFDPFFTTKPAGQGTGLGLTIAHKIVVDRHGGSLTARSTPGRGATFTVALPREARS